MGAVAEGDLTLDGQERSLWEGDIWVWGSKKIPGGMNALCKRPKV